MDCFDQQFSQAFFLPKELLCAVSSRGSRSQLIVHPIYPFLLTNLLSL
jgi:hypothetical protein